MSEIKLFRIDEKRVHELNGSSVALEKSLQHLMEQHLEDLLGVRFVASEHSTGEKHGGRIDTLGIDENGCPVIIEYKRSTNENVINQGLFYLDWLMDHKADFVLLVSEKLGKGAADAIAWGIPRLLCIAGDFTKYDEHAVQQIGRNIELIRYRHYGDLLLLELLNAGRPQTVAQPLGQDGRKKYRDKTVSEQLEQADQGTKDRFEAVKAYLVALGDDVQVSTLKRYVAFKRIRNFACVEAKQRVLTVYLRLDPDAVKLERGFTRDVREIGHWGTGDLEVVIRTDDDLRRSEPLFARAYDAT